MSTFSRFLTPTRSRFRPACCGLSLALAVMGSSLVPSLFAAKAKETKEKDSGPVLMSRTGGAGGDSWADLKELQQAAAKGNPKAEAQLGEMLLRGELERGDVALLYVDDGKLGVDIVAREDDGARGAAE